MTTATNATKPLGRPPAPEHLVRSQRVVTFVTQAEHRQLSDFARVNGLSISAACHVLLQNAMKTELQKGQKKNGD
ncbi:MAG: hypothetical protein AB3N23_13730 [Paracoccaceae bacterium]